MAAQPMISMAAAQAGLDAILAPLNVGGAGVIKIFTGSPPATLETADTGTLLVSCALSATAFPGSTDPGSTGLATATANAISAGTAVATNTAGYFRAYPHTPTTTNGVVQGTVDTASADMILNTTAIVSGSTVTITSWVVTLPDGSGAD